MIFNHQEISFEATFFEFYKNFWEMFSEVFVALKPRRSDSLNEGLSHANSPVLSIAIPTIFVVRNCKEKMEIRNHILTLVSSVAISFYLSERNLITYLIHLKNHKDGKTKPEFFSNMKKSFW